MTVIDKEKIRAHLPRSAVNAFDDIVEQRVLGAGSHIHMIGGMIEAIAKSYEQEGSIAEMIERIQMVCDYFIATRGEASQAITNAIYQMTKGLHQHTATEDRSHIIQSILQVKDAYAECSRIAVDQAVSYAVEIGNRMDRILVYDYSSTVEKFLRGLTPGKTIVIAESRVINGGAPFVAPCLACGHKVQFLPDAGLMYAMKDCDGAFMGAETIYPDGTGFNTTGSDIVGLLCAYYQKPLYFISPLIKLDNRPVYGKEKTLVINDLTDKLAPVIGTDVQRGELDFRIPELIGVCPAHIKGYITEKGVIPSSQLYGIALQYLQELRGEAHV